MNTAQYINPKLIPGLTTYSSLDEPILLVLTNERADNYAPAMLFIIKEREEREGAVTQKGA